VKYRVWEPLHITHLPTASALARAFRAELRSTLTATEYADCVHLNAKGKGGHWSKEAADNYVDSEALMLDALASLTGICPGRLADELWPAAVCEKRLRGVWNGAWKEWRKLCKADARGGAR
jgi:hypothetical protein